MWQQSTKLWGSCTAHSPHWSYKDAARLAFLEPAADLVNQTGRNKDVPFRAGHNTPIPSVSNHTHKLVLKTILRYVLTIYWTVLVQARTWLYRAMAAKRIPVLFCVLPTHSQSQQYYRTSLLATSTNQAGTLLVHEGVWYHRPLRGFNTDRLGRSSFWILNHILWTFNKSWWSSFTCDTTRLGKRRKCNIAR